MKSYLIQFTELKVSRFIEAFGHETKDGKHYFHLVEDHSDWETCFEVTEVATIIESAEAAGETEKPLEKAVKAAAGKPAKPTRPRKRRVASEKMASPISDSPSLAAD